MGQVQEGADDALLRRVEAAFSALTDGAYAGVGSRQDDRGMARLLARRGEAAAGEEVGVEELSEGTRDQLFLALRLVAIEDHAAAGGAAPPFLGDDLLQSFDDRRAAAFHSLLTLSEQVQVVLLSHHEHLLEVARAALPVGALHLQRITDRPATGAAVPAEA